MLCAKCEQPIREAHLLAADDKYWHEDCLRCACCDVRLAELDKVCYIKARMPLCRRDYLRLYGRTGECVVCLRRILGFEFVMRIQENVYHLNCFCCQRCQLRFCVGDTFYIEDKTILCEQDYFDTKTTALRPRETKHFGSYKTTTASLVHTPDSQTYLPYIVNNVKTTSILPSIDLPFETLMKQTKRKSTNRSNRGRSSSNCDSIKSVGQDRAVGKISPDEEATNCSKLAFCSDDHSSGYGSPSPSSAPNIDRP